MKRPANKTAKNVPFELLAEPGSRVFVAGTFNNWDPTANALKDNPDRGHYKAVLRVPTGAHQYRFVVNGVWVTDPKCVDWMSDARGTTNSVLYV